MKREKHTSVLFDFKVSTKFEIFGMLTYFGTFNILVPIVRACHF